jgi:hypothetical protein
LNADRFLAIAGVLFGAPGFLLLFGAHVAVAAPFLAIGTLLFVFNWYRRLPPFTYEEVECTLAFGDDAKGACLTKRYLIRPNQHHLAQIVHKNIAAEGQILNLRWKDGGSFHKIPASWRKTNFGDTIVTIPIDPPKPAFAKFDGILEYDLVDSFPSDTESWEHVVDRPTKAMTLTLKLPAKRGQKSVTAKVSLGADPRPVTLTRITATEVVLEEPRPRLGATYTITWEW